MLKCHSIAFLTRSYLQPVLSLVGLIRQAICKSLWFAIVDLLIYCAVFVGSFVVFDSSKKLSGCLSYVGDDLILRTSIFVDDIRIESFRIFAFVVKIVWYFSAGVCGFNLYFVLLKNRLYTFTTWEKQPDSFSDKSKTTKGPTKTARYSSTSTIVNPAKVQTSTTILKF